MSIVNGINGVVGIFLSKRELLIMFREVLNHDKVSRDDISNFLYPDTYKNISYVVTNSISSYLNLNVYNIDNGVVIGVQSTNLEYAMSTVKSRLKKAGIENIAINMWNIKD